MSENIVIGKHTLESLTSGMYSEPAVVFREYIQNCVDSIDNAIEKGILQPGHDQITVRLSPMDKRIIIRDNGLGIPGEDAEKTLISIGNSKKTSTNSRGFRGIGRLSALSYCKQLTFLTSTPGEAFATKVVFDADKLAELLSNETKEDITAVDVLQKVCTVEVLHEKDTAHYFSVQMDGVKDSSKLNSYTEVINYLTQNVPVPFNPDFMWGKEIVSRLKHEGHSISSYNVSVIFGSRVTPIYKPYHDVFLVDKSKGMLDRIQDIDIIKITREDGNICAIGWTAKINYLGSIYDKSIKGIRLRKGNILIGDFQTLNSIFKDARFNGWSIGEIFAVDQHLIPNARRDNFEKNAAYFVLFEQLSHLAATISKNIRLASLQRNAELSDAISQTDKVSNAAINAIDEGISSTKKGVLSQKLKTVQSTVSNLTAADSAEKYYQEIAFEDLDMIIGKLKGATSYKAINAIEGLTNAEKKVLEKVLNVISNLSMDDSEIVIDAILKSFSRE